MIGGRIILCHSKARDEEVTGNYRGIALGSLATRMLAGRLSKFSENHIVTECQGGFRPVKGCADPVLVLRSVYDIMSLQGRRHFCHFWM